MQNSIVDDEESESVLSRAIGRGCHTGMVTALMVESVSRCQMVIEYRNALHLFLGISLLGFSPSIVWVAD
jgi:hypothetical protein